MKKSIIMALFAFAVASFVMVASPSQAVHKGVGNLTCGNCHTMHSSQGGQSAAAMGTETGSVILLRAPITGGFRYNIHEFCLQCHSQEGSQGGATALPLAITPPKVLTTFGYTNLGDAGFAGFNKVGAGGDFGDAGMTYSGTTFSSAGTRDDGTAATTARGRAHSLGSAIGIVPPGNSITGTSTGTAGLDSGLSCTSCHDPHGTDVSTQNINIFRNLKTNTSNRGANFWENAQVFGPIASSYAGGASGCKIGVDECTSGDGLLMGTNTGNKLNTWPVYCLSADCGGTAGENHYRYAAFTADYAGTVNAKAAADGGEYVGMSLFCAQCHGSWHEDVVNAGAGGNVSGNDWKRHPVNNTLLDGTPNSGGSVPIFDEAYFTAAGTSDPTGSRLPVATAVGDASYTLANGGDATTARIFCLSCHFVHGSPNYDILRWDYVQFAGTGSQSGNGVRTDQGCQTCHNR